MRVPDPAASLLLQPAVFLDLNGTLVMPVQAESPDEYQIIPGTVEAVAMLNASGFVCPIVTVQSRIAKGLYSEDEFRSWFAQFQADLRERHAEVVGPYVCPHRIADDCMCAKPQPTLYLEAATKHSIDLSRSWVVGDTEGDIHAANYFGGLGSCYVRTGWGPNESDEREGTAAFVGDDLLTVARWIVEQKCPA